MTEKVSTEKVKYLKSLGADVPFLLEAVSGKLTAARAQGIGEILKPVELPPVHLVLAKLPALYCLLVDLHQIRFAGDASFARMRLSVSSDMPRYEAICVS